MHESSRMWSEGQDSEETPVIPPLGYHPPYSNWEAMLLVRSDSQKEESQSLFYMPLSPCSFPHCLLMTFFFFQPGKTLLSKYFQTGEAAGENYSEQSLPGGAGSLAYGSCLNQA